MCRCARVSPRRFKRTRFGFFRVSYVFPVLRDVHRMLSRPLSRARRCRGRRNEVSAADSQRGEVPRPRFDSEAEDRTDRCSTGQTTRSSVLPMRTAKAQFVEQTLTIWQPRTSKGLTSENARQIAENATGFFQTLMEWQVAEQHTASEVTCTETDARCHSAERCPE